MRTEKGKRKRRRRRKTKAPVKKKEPPVISADNVLSVNAPTKRQKRGSVAAKATAASTQEGGQPPLETQSIVETDKDKGKEKVRDGGDDDDDYQPEEDEDASDSSPDEELEDRDTIEQLKDTTAIDATINVLGSEGYFEMLLKVSLFFKTKKLIAN